MAGKQRRDEPGADRFGYNKASGAEVVVEQWVCCWWGTMVRVAANRLKDRDVAEDIAQQAFMKALSIARSDPSAVETVRNPCRWLTTITRKLASGLLRTEGRRRRLRRENADEILEQLFPHSDGGSEEDSRLKRVLEIAKDAIRTLRAHMFPGGGVRTGVSVSIGLRRVSFASGAGGNQMGGGRRN